MILDQPVSGELCWRSRRRRGVPRVLALMIVAAVFSWANLVSVSSAIADQLQSAAGAHAQVLSLDRQADGRAGARVNAAGLLLSETLAPASLDMSERACLLARTDKRMAVETIRRMGRDIAPWRIEHIVVLAAVMSPEAVENSRWRGMPRPEHGGPKAAGNGTVARAPPAPKENLPGIGV